MTRLKSELFLVATPIGNLKDLSPRAKDILETAEIIFCEDTRRFRNLNQGLNLNIQGKIFSFFKNKEALSTQKAIVFLKQGKKVALVSDAGTPLIADPGFILVKSCRDLGIKVIPIPGPSAFLLALTASGFPCSKFVFLGYLPKAKSRARKTFKECQKIAIGSGVKTFVLYESPHRLVKTLVLFEKAFGNKLIFLARELTKIHETNQLMKVKDLIELYKGRKVKGEITIVFYLAK